ncbi:MAG TPA: metallophosphoesterase [Xanthomonadales bacterium]|nr:metallophosphoesterase [Xanthomonadales bacterium]
MSTTNWVEGPFPHDDVDVFAIGDIHGCPDELEALHTTINSVKPSAESNIVHLGDYVDRGPGSARVLEYLADYSESNDSAVFIRGNHDQFLIELVQPDPDPDLDRYFINMWYENGGTQTMRSLGVNGYGRLLEQGNIAELRKRTIAALGEQRIDFLLSTTLHHQVGNYLFVHAGIRPGMSLEEQDFSDLLLIREPFLSAQDNWDHPFCVVHGHSISTPGVLPHRIAVDAGVYLNGTLCAVQISKQGIRFIGVTKDADFSWGERFDNPSIGLSWKAARQL